MIHDTILTEGPVTLRALKDADSAAMAQFANNKKVVDNLRDLIPFPYAEKDAVTFISLVKDQQPLMIFGIEFNGQFCGIIGLTAQTDVYRNSAEIGYWLGEPFWNKGILTIAAGLVTHYAFGQLGYTRIFTGVFEYNIPSMRVLEKNGFIKEGIFEKSIFKKGRFWNEHRYAKIKATED